MNIDGLTFMVLKINGQEVQRVRVGSRDQIIIANPICNARNYTIETDMLKQTTKAKRTYFLP